MKTLYLSSCEYNQFKEPREIIEFRRITIGKRDVLVVTVDKPLIGQSYGWGADDIFQFYLINRYAGESFDSLDSFPIRVHVCIPKDKTNKNPSEIPQLSA